MRLYLVRHGDALSDSEDPKRPLSETGIEEAKKTGEFLKKAGEKPLKIIHSTKLRAKQTGEIIAEVFRETGPKTEEVDFLSPSSNPLPYR